MYEKFYRLNGVPFALTPDPRFFFGSASHNRAISHLIYGLSQQEGFVVITGEVGAGKTTLVEQLWAQLDRRSYTIGRVVTTQVSNDDLLRLVVSSFGANSPSGDKASLLRRFEQTLREHRSQGRRCLLVVDEVQNLSFPALEELRMLSNMTIDGKPSLQTILLGQPQFRPILASPELDQLRQRVLASYHLGPLTQGETQAYVEHRLRMVSWMDDPEWEPAAFDALFRRTDGIPRRINTLCTRILLFGALEEAHLITADMVTAVASELEQDLGPAVARPEVVAHSAINGSGVEDLTRRVNELERNTARQERIFRRLLDVLGGIQTRA